MWCSTLTTMGSLSHLQQPDYWIKVLLLIWTASVQYTEGCYRKPVIRTTTTAIPTTTVMGDHRLPCTEDEIHNEAKCQEGRCQAVDLGGFRYVSCHCDIGFTGERCELRYIDPSILSMESTQMKVRTAQIAGGVSVAILILFVLILAIYVLIRKRRKDRARTVNLEEPDREEARHLNEKQNSPHEEHSDHSWHDGGTSTSQREEYSDTLHPYNNSSASSTTKQGQSETRL